MPGKVRKPKLCQSIKGSCHCRWKHQTCSLPKGLTPTRMSCEESYLSIVAPTTNQFPSTAPLHLLLHLVSTKYLASDLGDADSLTEN